MLGRDVNRQIVLNRSKHDNGPRVRCVMLPLRACPTTLLPDPVRPQHGLDDDV